MKYLLEYKANSLRKTIVILKYEFNASFSLGIIPKCPETAQVLKLIKLDQLGKQVTSYLLIWLIFHLFEKLLF